MPPTEYQDRPTVIVYINLSFREFHYREHRHF